MTREIAIIQWNEKNNINEMLTKFPKGSSIRVFVKNGLVKPEGIEAIEMPVEVNSIVKSKNFVIDWHKQNKPDSWLHVLEDSLDIVKSPVDFMNDIENMLEVLDLNSWLDTTTDVCNRVYAKYNPRVRVNIDQPEFQKFNLGQVVFCSHSNVQWMVFNIAKGDENELHFNDQFLIPMYWIIEYLARRRNTHLDSLYFMNQYITCKSEENLFKNKSINDSDKKPEYDEAEQMKIEDQMFKAMNVNYSPDNSVDMILERLLNKLRSKIG